MADIPTLIASLRAGTVTPAAIAALMDGVTPGPWNWQVSAVSKSVELSGGRQSKAGGDLTVMTFKRWGINGAAPVFWSWEGNYATRVERADAITVPEVGREHHKTWFARIDHPDARFIAAARELVPALAAERDRLLAWAEKNGADVDAAVAERTEELRAERDRLAAQVEALTAELARVRAGTVTPADLDAAADALAGKVAVKLLEWKEANHGNFRKGECYHARSPVDFAPLAVHKKHDGWWLNVDCRTYPTIEAAKAAAQADYAARILAALEPAPLTVADALTVPEVRALVDAAADFLFWDLKWENRNHADPLGENGAVAIAAQHGEAKEQLRAALRGIGGAE